MIDTTIGTAPTTAPAGFLGLEGADVRSSAAGSGHGLRAVVRTELKRRLAAAQGTGAPIAGMAPALPFDPTAQNDGTILGIPSSRRPRS